TVLFAQIHATPEGTEHLRVALRYLIWIGDKHSRQATEQVLHSVMDARQAEALMRSYGEQLVERGVKRGRAQDVVRILTARGIHLDEQSRQRILMCRDLALLDQWFDRAINATRLGDVLDQ
ncbi:MAG TPA: transposase, partial [Archangium sp.]|nr:transposase [Archangium sp.]